MDDSARPQTPLHFDARRRSLLFGCLLAVSLHAFDELAVVTALPVIAKDLGGRALYGSVFFAYVLASIVGLVAAGWLATKFGPGRPLGWGLTVFAVGLGIAAVAPTMEIVVAARALQGLGGGALNTIVLVIVSRAFEPDERPHVMAWTSSAWVIPSLIAPAVAGSLAEAVGWRWVFIGLLPLVGVAAALALPATRSLRGSTPERPFRTDISNGVRLAAGVGLLLTAFSREFSASNAIFAVCGSWMAVPALGRVVPGGFWLASSIIPAAVFAKFLLGFAFFGTEGFVPLAMTEIHGTSAAYAGLSLTAAALSWTAGAFVQARLAARCTSRMLAASGAALVAAAIVLMLPLLDAHTHPAIAFVAWSLAGFGMGIAYNTITTKAMAHTAAGEEGPLSTSLGVADAVGISLGTGMVGALVSFGDRAGWATADSLGLSWGATAAVALLACGIALRLGSGVVGKVQAGESAPAPQPAS